MLSEAKSAAGGQKIALIDDEQTILDLYSRVLGKEFEVLTAINGEDGLELIEKEKPALVLVDIRMPKMDGLEMIQEMKEKKLLNIPVLILTNLSDDAKVAKAIELGAKEYILKVKSTPTDILEKVKNYLG